MTQSLQYEVAGHSHVGAVRKVNEDSVDWFRSATGEVVLAVVADGMGGHAGGAKASQTAVEVFVATLAPSIANRKLLSPALIEQAMYRAGVEAHNAIHEAKAENPNFMKMGTTIVSLWVQGNRAAILHVGDSRCYLARHHKDHCDMQQLTRDDSVVQMMVEEGTLNPAEAESSPYRNMLTQAVGSDGDILLNQLETEVGAGDLLLLCSDGLYNELSHQQIIGELRQSGALQNPSNGGQAGDLYEAAQRLVGAAVKAGGRDNVSAVLVRVT